MRVDRPKPGRPHPEQVRLEVDVGPTQRKSFSLTQTQGQGDRPPGSVPPAARRVQDRAHLVGRVWLHGVRLHPRRLRQRRHISSDMPTTSGLAKRRPQCPVHLMRRPGLGSRLDHLLVEPLQVLGLQPVQSLATEHRDDVLDDRSSIRRKARVTQARPGDVLQPVLKPRRQCPPMASAWNATSLPQLLQRAHLPTTIALVRPRT